MLTKLELFFLCPDANFSFQSQMLIFQKYIGLFHFWTFFLSIFEKSKYFLVNFLINIINSPNNLKKSTELSQVFNYCFAGRLDFFFCKIVLPGGADPGIPGMKLIGPYFIALCIYKYSTNIMITTAIIEIIICL